MDQNNTHQSQDKVSLWTRNFVIVALINMLAFFGFNMTNVGLPVYIASLGANDFAVGLVITLTTTAALIIRPFSGIILDRFNRKGVLISGLLIMAVTTFSYAIFPIVGVILCIRVIHGLGWGLGSTATSTLAADAVPKSRFAEGMGYIGLAGALATAIAPALAIALLQGSGAFIMIIIATSTTLVGFALALFEKPKKPEPDESDSIESLTKKTGFKASDFFERKALLPSAVIFLVTIAFGSITTFITLHGISNGIENISLYFVVYAVVTIITRPPMGKLIDRIGYFAPGLLSMVSVSICLVMLSVSTNIFMFCAAGVFAGLGIGTAMSTMQTMAVSSVPPQQRGVATSTYLFGLDAGIALGAVISGIIAGPLGYSTMYMMMAVFPLIGCIIFIVIGPKKISSRSK